MEQSRKNNTINFFKAIACIMVIFIHQIFPGEFGKAVVAISSSAVVYFFMVAGYFSYNPNPEKERKKAIKKIKDMLNLSLIAVVFYLLWGVFVRVTGTGISSAINWLYSLIFRIPMLLLYNVDIFAGHLWFIFALLYAYIVFLLISKLKCYKTATILFSIALVIHIIVSYFYARAGVFLNFLYTRNAWCYGIPCFLIANRLHAYLDTHQVKFKNNTLLSVMFASVVLTVIERFVIGGSQVYFGNIIFAYTSLIFAISNPNKLHQKQMCFIGENLSTDVYIYHWAIINIFVKFEKMFGVTVIYEWTAPVLVLAVSLLAAFLIYKFKMLFRRNK